WFCEGKELHNSPDIHISAESDGLYSLVIAEAFEDDTGRYICVASNSIGSDTSSAEVFVEGASSSDSDSEGFALKSNPGAMPQGVSNCVCMPSFPFSLHRHACQELQSITASEGQVVVLECRVKGTPPAKVKWFRQGTEIQDSPDFRILQKKPRCASEPEEICTLVIAETFPEDAGTFTCTARNEYGSVTCNAQLTVISANNEHTRNDVSSGDISSYDFQPFLPPPMPESSWLEISSKNTSQSFQASNEDSNPNFERSHPQLSSVGNKSNGVYPNNGVNGVHSNQDKKYMPATSPLTILSPTKEPPPVLAKPKLDSKTIQQLQNQIRQEQEVAVWQQQAILQQNSPPSPSFPLPPSLQELEASQFSTSQVPMSILNSHSSPAMQPASSFNYARPKQFIAAQNMSPASGYVSPSSGSSTSSLPSPMSPSTPQKLFGRVPVPPFSQPFAQEGEQFWSHQTSSSRHRQQFCPSPIYSPYPSPTGRPPGSSHSPAAFLSSMLPSQPSPISFNELGLPKGVMPPGFPKKSSRTARIASDEEIQGTKDAVIQDLERKLRFKEEFLNNGQPKLTYEEKMARRLLGADNAATVFNLQEQDEDMNAQEYKVSSFEQRLISEIEYRLERSPVEESDEEVDHEDDLADNSTPPQFDTKLKHYKIFEGMPTMFTCKVLGNPKPKTVSLPFLFLAEPVKL
ncbi:hypothetical protein FKM82_001172, partial [Ascaphus truei]